jgi:hypothetical protein
MFLLYFLKYSPNITDVTVIIWSCVENVHIYISSDYKRNTCTQNDTGGIDIEICNILINLPLFLEDEKKHVSVSILIMYVRVKCITWPVMYVRVRCISELSCMWELGVSRDLSCIWELDVSRDLSCMWGQLTFLVLVHSLQ